MDDLISRQAAIEHLWNNIAYMRAFGCARAITLIREVPPAQPEHEYTMEEFMYGQDMGNPEDGSL